MKFNIKHALVLCVLLGLAWWNWPRPDTFFADLSLPVSSRFIVSHRSPFWLKSLEDRLVLRIPRTQAGSVLGVFAAQKRFEDVSPNLPRHYEEFRGGLEDFLPVSCPQSFRAGRFQAFDRQRHFYSCSFLFDQDDPKVTVLYLDSLSPID